MTASSSLKLSPKLSRKPSRKHGAAGFSLIEVLMSIFILGIGVISIAALFPAGIAQQRQSTDDVMGPLVANNALAIIRTKLKQDDFGSFEEFGPLGMPLCPPIGGRRAVCTVAGGFRPTIEGDWGWMRPAFLFPDPPESALPQNGAIDVFNGIASTFPEHASESSAGLPLDIPYNTREYGAAPVILVTQEERYYPQWTRFAPEGLRPRPEYVWECMFRRFGGKVLVAIFVYRVNAPGGETGRYTVAPNGLVPPLPIWLDLEMPSSVLYSADGVWDANGPNDPPGPGGADTPTTGDDNIVYGFSGPAGDFDVATAGMAWQAGGQWILDQNNDVHRVLSASRDNASRPVEVELVRPIVPKAPVNSGFQSVHYPPADVLVSDYGGDYVVADIWYLPLIDTNGVQLTPVYVTVKEL